MLDSLHIIELSAFVAAPLCGLTLSQLGADVIRVDPPGGNMDTTRMPHAPGGGSLYWASLNRGKRSMEIDFRKPAGRELVGRMLAASGKGGGILVTNLGLDGELSYASLRQQRDDVIVVQLVGSPDDRRELDYTVNCGVGFPYMTGPAGAGPVNHVLPAWDVAAGLMLANAVLAAAYERERTGRGAFVTIALSDVAMGTVSNLGYIADATVNANTRTPDGNHLYGAYGDCFATADGRHVYVATISGAQWQALLKPLGLAASLEAAAAALGIGLADERERYEARGFISAALRPWFAKRTLAEVEQVLGASKALWGVYRTLPQMLAEDPRATPANPMFEEVENPGLGRWRVARTPLAIDGAARRPAGLAPRIGEHTQSVLASLAIAPAEVGRLAAAGAFGKREPDR